MEISVSGGDGLPAADPSGEAAISVDRLVKTYRLMSFLCLYVLKLCFF